MQSENYKKAHSNKTIEQKHREYESRKATCLTKYGEEWVTKTSEFKEKVKTSKLEKYGYEYYNNSIASAKKNRSKTATEQNDIASKRRRTNVDRFGVENCFLLPKALARASKSNAAGKDYVMPSGKTVGVRGYEDRVLDTLLKSYSEDSIALHDSRVKFTLPIFEYVNVNQHTAKYYPDIYIREENKIIEVKSIWWWNGNGAEKYKSRLENNLRKRAAVVASGYIYEVWLFDGSNYRILTNDTDFQA